MIKTSLKYTYNNSRFLGNVLLKQLGLYNKNIHKVNFIVEKKDWAIKRVGNYICENINMVQGQNYSDVFTNSFNIMENIVHFGSQYMWTAYAPYKYKDVKYVTSFFHGKREDGKAVSKHIDKFLSLETHLSKIITSSKIVEDRLLGWGVSPGKLVRIPIGVDTKLFKCITPEDKANARIKFNIPTDVKVIGSFQKDGVGWGEGLTPKLIKGPDVFVEAVRYISKQMPVFVFLVGPARGYVIRKLEKYNIPYKHLFAENYHDLVECYAAIDIYLISSREEGGPMALMESMSSGVPVVSTNVGMSPDLISDLKTGGLVDSEDVEGLADKCLIILNDNSLYESVKKSGLNRIQEYDWYNIANLHLEKVYKKLL